MQNRGPGGLRQSGTRGRRRSDQSGRPQLDTATCRFVPGRLPSPVHDTPRLPEKTTDEPTDSCRHRADDGLRRRRRPCPDPPTPHRPIRHHQPLPPRLRLGRAPRRPRMGIDQRRRDRAGRQHLGRGALRCQLVRRLRPRPHPPLRHRRQPAAQLRRRYDRVAARHRCRPRGQRLGDRRLGAWRRNDRPRRAQVLPRGASSS